jgi:hypothetical protein
VFPSVSPVEFRLRDAVIDREAKARLEIVLCTVGCLERVVFGVELGSKIGELSCGLVCSCLVTRCCVVQLVLELGNALFELGFTHLEQGETVVALQTRDLVRACVLGAFQDGQAFGLERDCGAKMGNGVTGDEGVAARTPFSTFA